MVIDSSPPKVGRRKGQILEAALTLFAERGYAATGMEDIAAALGMAPSSLYNHWRSKQSLLQVIMETTVLDLLAEAELLIRDAPSPHDALRSLMDHYVRYHVTHSDSARVSLRERSSLDAEAETRLTSMHGSYAELWQEVIESGVSAGEFEVTSARMATYALLEMGIGVSQWTERIPSMTVDEIVEVYKQMALNLVRYRL